MNELLVLILKKECYFFGSCKIPKGKAQLGQLRKLHWAFILFLRASRTLRCAQEIKYYFLFIALRVKD